MYKTTIILLLAINLSNLAAQDKLKAMAQISMEMLLRVEQGICQKEWIGEASQVRVFSTKSDSQILYAVPCSLWAHNQAWSFFLVIDRGEQAVLVKPLFFIRYSSYKGLYADTVVENISWDDEQKILTSRKYLNGNQHCGELSGYKWRENSQDFEVLSIYKNDDCNSVDYDWAKVL
jgi:hypothetical protein